MIHAREDYNRIQDPDGKIPEDEPVFLIRAQDTIGWKIVEEYVKLRRREHFRDEKEIDEMSRAILDHANKMREWPKKKIADL